MDTRRAKSDVLYPSSKSWSTATLKKERKIEKKTHIKALCISGTFLWCQRSVQWDETQIAAHLCERRKEKEKKKKISAFSQRLDLISVSAGGCVFWLSVCNTSTEQNSSAKQLHKSALISERHVCHISPPLLRLDLSSHSIPAWGGNILCIHHRWCN